MKKIIILLIFSIFAGGCGGIRADEGKSLRISAASSLTGVLTEAEKEYSKLYPELELIINYGSSSKLRNQIEQGAPADLFLSASEIDMEKLVETEFITGETVVPFAGNRLILAAGAGVETAKGREDLAAILGSTDETVAIGEPESVPLGMYTKKALTDLGLWNNINDRSIYAKDARQVLTYLESGNAGLGIVYASDIAISEKIEVLTVFPEEVQIVYPAGITAASGQREEAAEFLSFLTGKEGQQLMEQYGFEAADGGKP